MGAQVFGAAGLSQPPTELIAAFTRPEANTAHKLALIQSMAKKGPVAIQAAVETAAKVAKRRDSFVKKLTALGVVLKV